MSFPRRSNWDNLGKFLHSSICENLWIKLLQASKIERKGAHNPDRDSIELLADN